MLGRERKGSKGREENCGGDDQIQWKTLSNQRHGIELMRKLYEQPTTTKNEQKPKR